MLISSLGLGMQRICLSLLILSPAGRGRKIKVLLKIKKWKLEDDKKLEWPKQSCSEVYVKRDYSPFLHPGTPAMIVSMLSP